MTMDFVYLLKHDIENNSEEFRYSLRSLCNIPHERVVVIGDKPKWLKNVLHIPVAQDKTKHENVNANIKAAIADNQISDEFVLMNDDFFIMQPLDKIEPLHFGNMQEVIDHYRERYQEDTPYIQNMVHAMKLLQSHGYANPYSYELHMPMVMQRSKLKELYEEYDGRLYQFRSYYGNYAQVGGDKVTDVKVFLDPTHNDKLFNDNPRKYLASQQYLSATGGAFKKGIVGEFIRNVFVEKSSYEL